MTKDEALTMALEALENAKLILIGLQTIGIKAGATSQAMRLGEQLFKIEPSPQSKKPWHSQSRINLNQIGTPRRCWLRRCSEWQSVLRNWKLNVSKCNINTGLCRFKYIYHFMQHLWLITQNYLGYMTKIGHQAMLQVCG